MSHGGNPWPLLEEGLLRKEEILDFSSDLNPLGPPGFIGRLLQEACGQVGWYPEPTYQRFREAAARAHGVDPSCILPGNGTAGLIHLISRWKKGAKAAVVVPTFTEYERAVRADGGTVLPWRLEERDGFAAPPPGEAESLGGADLLFLCNPNNPTGTLWTEEQLFPLLRLCRERGILAVIDEAYLDFAAEEGCSVIPWVGRSGNLIVLRSLTKGFAVPGLRVGFLSGSPEIVASLREIQPPWEMNGPAALAGCRLMEEKEFLTRSMEEVRRLRQGLWEGLRRLPGLHPFPTAANFVLCRITDRRWPNGRLAGALRRQGILVRSCDDFTGLEKGRFIRIAVRSDQENGRLLERLRELLGDAG